MGGQDEELVKTKLKADSILKYQRRHDNRQDPQPTGASMAVGQLALLDVGAVGTNTKHETTGASVEP